LVRFFLLGQSPFIFLGLVFETIVHEFACCVLFVLCWQEDFVSLCLTYCCTSVLFRKVFFDWRVSKDCPPPLGLLCGGSAGRIPELTVRGDVEANLGRICPRLCWLCLLRSCVTLNGLG